MTFVDIVPLFIYVTMGEVSIYIYIYIYIYFDIDTHPVMRLHGR